MRMLAHAARREINSALRESTRLQGMDAPKKYNCKCGVAFTSERSLNFHRGSRACRLRDPAAVRFSCPDCKFTAYYQITLDKHRQIRHSNKTPFQCKCGIKFQELEHLLEHQETVFSCKKYHTCRLCGHISPTQGQLNRHFRSHSEEKPFVCECGRAYPRKDSYYRHQRGCRALAEADCPTPAASTTPAAVANKVSAHAATSAIGGKVKVEEMATPSPASAAVQVSPVGAPSLVSNSLPSSSNKLPTMLPSPSTLPQFSSALPRFFNDSNHMSHRPQQQPQQHPQYQPRQSPPMVQVHAPMFVPRYSGHYVRMMEPPLHTQTEAPQPNQLLNLSYLASMKQPINMPVPSDTDVPELGPP